MNARLLLLVALAAGLAALGGCTEYHEGSIILEPADDEKIVNETSFTPGTMDFGNPHEHQLVVDAIADGSATYNGTHTPGEYYVNRPVSWKGSYYDVSFESLDEWDGYEVAARLDYNASELPNETVQLENLSAADRRGLEPWFEWSNATEAQPGDDAAIAIYYTPAERNESVLYGLDNATAVEHEGETFRVDVFAATPEEGLQTFRATATEMSEGTTELADQVRDRYEFSFSDLSRGERSILNDARGEYYYAETTDDEDFDALVDSFMEHEAVRQGSASGEWLLRYDGETYWVDLHFGPFASS